MENLSVYIIKRDFVIIRDLYREMKIFLGKLRYNQSFAIASYVINRDYCMWEQGEIEKGYSGAPMTSTHGMDLSRESQFPL